MSLFFAQTSSGVGINFSSQVGCQTYANAPERDKYTLFLTDISSTNCIRVCENSQITYSLFGSLAPSPNTIWIVTGGIITNQTSITCTIARGIAGSGQLNVSTQSTTGSINSTICFTKIINPTASINIFGNLTPDKPFLACVDQIVTFLNTSTSNSGPDLMTYLWDFGDGTTSSLFQPNHQYASIGDYGVTLTVFNSCYCSSDIKIIIKVGNPGFEIICPSIVCEGQIANYSIPANIASMCGSNGTWIVVGGSVTSQTPNTVNVNWNQVNETGFGSVTFNPAGCNLSCKVPTTIKIPVIKTIGTIIGSPTLCLGQQSRYKLPQWPSTDFQWEIIGNVVNNLSYYSINPTNGLIQLNSTPIPGSRLLTNTLCGNVFPTLCQTLNVVITVPSLKGSNSQSVQITNMFDIEKTLITPNPTAGKVILNFNDNIINDYKIELFDFLGRVLLEKQIVKDTLQYELDLSNFSDAHYYIRLSAATTNTTFNKIII